MQPALLDSAIYITAMRQGDRSVLSLRRYSVDAALWLSAVVLDELYAGAYGRVRQVVERLERDFDSVNRILVPNLGDWARSGRILARVASKYNYENIGLGRLTNDALIATSSSRMGVRVVTANEQDFSRLSEFHTFQWETTKL